MMRLKAFEKQATNYKHQESGKEISEVETKRIIIHDQPNKEQAPWKS